MSDQYRQDERSAALGSLPLSVIAWLAERVKEDPEFLDKLAKDQGSTGRTDRSEPGDGGRGEGRPDPDSEDLEGVLGRLSGMFGGELESEADVVDDDELSEEVEELVDGGSANGPESDESREEGFRAWVAREVYYLTLVPPIPESVLVDLHETVLNFLHLLKQLKRSPYLRQVVHEAMASATTKHGGDRSISEGDDFEQLMKRMGQDMAGGDSDERVLPIAVLVIGAAIAACTGGVTVGRAVHEATH